MLIYIFDRLVNPEHIVTIEDIDGLCHISFVNGKNLVLGGPTVDTMYKLLQKKTKEEGERFIINNWEIGA